MTKPMARQKRPHAVDTEDHVTERILEAVTWAESHRRTVMVGVVALVAVVAGVFYYQDYRAKLAERASVRLQEIQLAAQSQDSEVLRSELRLFVDQFSGTIYAGQARVALAGLELQRDSATAAIRVLEPVADLESGEPLAFTAAGMIAAAYEQVGEPDRALRQYERIEAAALFDQQRHTAMAEQARIHLSAGRYSQAVSLYERLQAESGDEPGALDVYAVRLGEARALERSGAAPPAPPREETVEPDPATVEGEAQVVDSGPAPASDVQ